MENNLFDTIPHLNSECLINFELYTIYQEIKTSCFQYSFYFFMGFSIRLFV